MIVAGAVAFRGEIAHVLGRRAARAPALRRRRRGRPSRSAAILTGLLVMMRTLLTPSWREHLGRELEAALVLVEAQHLVGVVGVVALRLELVGADLVGDAVPAALLVEIEQDAALAFRHVADGVAELVAAIAFEAAEEIAGEARGVQPHRDRPGEIRAADDDRDLVAQALAAAEDHELGLRRAFERHRRAADDLHVPGLRAAIGPDRLALDPQHGGRRASAHRPARRGPPAARGRAASARGHLRRGPPAGRPAHRCGRRA